MLNLLKRLLTQLTQAEAKYDKEGKDQKQRIILKRTLVSFAKKKRKRKNLTHNLEAAMLKAFLGFESKITFVSDLCSTWSFIKHHS